MDFEELYRKIYDKVDEQLSREIEYDEYGNPNYPLKATDIKNLMAVIESLENSSQRKAENANMENMGTVSLPVDSFPM